MYPIKICSMQLPTKEFLSRTSVTKSIVTICSQITHKVKNFFKAKGSFYVLMAYRDQSFIHVDWHFLLNVLVADIVSL
jgi:hypothetical protein